MKPEASAAALELYEALDPAFTQYDEGTDWTTLKFCSVLTGGDLDLLHELVTETDDRVPWELLFDPEACPAVCLPYLAQYTGTRLQPDMTEAEQRAAIAEPPGFQRGTVAHIEATARRFLTGSKFVKVVERYTGLAWRIRVETLAPETPDQTALEEAIKRESKPVGILMFLNSHPVWNWLEVRTEKATWLKVREDFPTWLAARSAEP